ncbi:class I SAM-dependent methyltransferase [Arvimicrobium flavum]|uniref:class I SAM-dependent methyltransferase n=1 Tax=Arvimicrobium flavum TaxID=3393320 RepID=UPI00237A8367|nr:class I SAM-dependent methyltransferase [Mesorhizobium shangrilense]
MDDRIASPSLPQEPAKPNPHANRDSLEFGFRSKRFVAVQRLIQKVLDERGSCDIVDLGGTELYWLIGDEFLQRNRGRINITLVNLELEAVDDQAMFASMVGNATDLSLMAGRTFDLVHSNSTIEHVGNLDDMARFASNVRRLAPRYYVQTPNFWFPYEPHFRFPGFQYLPEFVRVALLRRFSLGFFHKVPDRAEATDIIQHHRLIGAGQMRSLFPDATVTFEKVMTLNKSIIAIRG